MLISGTRFRSIYPQSVVNWNFNFQPTTSTGVFDFSFISNSGNIDIFSIKNGKIFTTDGKLLGGYTPYSDINLSGNVSNGFIDLYDTNGPLYLGYKTTNFSYITGFKLNSYNNFIDFKSLNILGDVPQYFYDNTLPYKSGDLIKVNIFNSGEFDFKIFSGSINTNIFSLSGTNNLIIPKNNSGNFYLIHNGIFIDFLNTKIILDTDFGTKELPLLISGTRVEDQLYYITIGPEIVSIPNNYFQDYSITFKNSLGVNLSVELKYISGVTGEYYKPVTQTGLSSLTHVSGLISGSGFLYGESSGTIFRFNPLRGFNEFGTGFGIARDFKIAEDQYIERFFIISGSGRGEVYLKTGIFVTGYSTGVVYSGYITYLGGTLTGSISNALATGLTPDSRRNWTVNSGVLIPSTSNTNVDSICIIRPELCPTLFPPNISIQTLTGLVTGNSTTFYNYTGPITGYYEDKDLRIIDLIAPKVFITGDFEDYYDIIGLAYAVGPRVSGKFIGELTNFVEPGFWTIYKNWSGKLSGEGFVEWTGRAFDPVTMEIGLNSFTGYWSGRIETGFFVDFCNLIQENPFPCAFEVLGTPEYVQTVGNTGIFYRELNKVNIITQKNIGYQYLEWPNDNSDFLINSGNISLHREHPKGGRTRISRLGGTPSGSGKFDNVFQFPFYQGVNTQKFETGDGGELLLITGSPVLKFNFKLDASGNKIPIYSGYLCEYVRTGNNEIAIINGFPVPIPLNCDNSSQCSNRGVCYSGICWDHKFEFGRFIFDVSGNPVPDLTKYQCKPQTGISGELLLNPLIDISGSIYTRDQNGKLSKVYTIPGSENNVAVPMYEMVPDMFIASQNFFGWKESLQTLTGRAYPEGRSAFITGISGKGFMANICDTTYFHFEITGTGNEPNSLSASFFTPETGRLLIYKLYKKGDGIPIQQQSGGLYYYTGKNLIVNSTLNTGDYYSTLDFLPVQCLKEYSNTCLYFSHPVYTGCKTNGYLGAAIHRTGYDDFTIKLRATAYFTGPYYPYVSQEVLKSGMIWDFELGPNENYKEFSFPLFYNNKLERDTFGKFHLAIREIGEFPPWLVGIRDDEADFIIKNEEQITTGISGKLILVNTGCFNTINTQGLQPVNSGLYAPLISPLGPDLQKIEGSRPNLSNWGYRCSTGEFEECFCSQNINIDPCANIICTGNFILDPSSCSCVPPVITGCSGTGCLPPPPVEVECSGAQLVISGFAFYRDSISTPCNVPGIGNILPSCAGGHRCDRTDFLPVLQILNGPTINANKQISLNNGAGGGNRDDSFSFTIPDSSIISGKQVNFSLQCRSNNNNCHNGVSFVVLTIENSGNTQTVFKDCVLPNELSSLPFVCADVGCYSKKFRVNELLQFTGTKIFMHSQCANTTPPFVDGNRKSACLRWVCACFTGNNGLSSLYTMRQIGGSTINNLNLTGVLWNQMLNGNVIPPDNCGCYLYEFEFSGWQSRSPNSQWQSADDCFNIYNLIFDELACPISSSSSSSSSSSIELISGSCSGICTMGIVEQSYNDFFLDYKKDDAVVYNGDCANSPFPLAQCEKYYRSTIGIPTFCSASLRTPSILSKNQILSLKYNVPTWQAQNVIEGPDVWGQNYSYHYVHRWRIFSGGNLWTLTNFRYGTYLPSSTILNTPLPQGLFMPKWNLISGTPTVTGIFQINLTQVFNCSELCCDNNYGWPVMIPPPEGCHPIPGGGQNNKVDRTFTIKIC